MAADTNPNRAEVAGARGVVGEKVQDGTGVRVVRSELFSDLVGIASLGARRVVGEDDTRIVLKLVEDLRHGDGIAVAGEKGGGTTDGPGHLEDLGEQNEPGIAPRSRRSEHVRAHRAVLRLQFDVFLRGDVHGLTIEDGQSGGECPNAGDLPNGWRWSQVCRN